MVILDDGLLLGHPIYVSAAWTANGEAFGDEL